MLYKEQEPVPERAAVAEKLPFNRQEPLAGPGSCGDPLLMVGWVKEEEEEEKRREGRFISLSGEGFLSNHLITAICEPGYISCC